MTSRQTIKIAKAKAVGALKSSYNVIRSCRKHVFPQHRRKHKESRQLRLEAERIFYDMAHASPQKFKGRVLIDAVFDNPNFWYRLTLLRTALGTAHSEEIGFTGIYNAHDCRQSLHTLGINEVKKFENFYPEKKLARQQARDLLANLHDSWDILKWKLPYDFPAVQAYDDILKQQRKAEVDIHDPLLEQYLTTCLQKLHAAHKIIDEGNFDLIMISQISNFDEGGLAWIAAQHGIPTLLVAGHSGLPRFRKYTSTERVFAGGDRASTEDIAALSAGQLEKLEHFGAEYLSCRQSGKVNELSSILAYRNRTDRINRRQLQEMFNWDQDRPIIVVYSSNWFDYPHAFGMTNFRDFLDWLECTLEAAIKNTSVNWLFKGHPVDKWYGGITLNDVMPEQLAGHIRIVPETFNSNDIIQCTDGMVTLHGSAGLEFSHSGRPVLVADRGWYHDIGFVTWARTREEYVERLSQDWWSSVDVEDAKRKSHVFAAMLYCCPDWQSGLINGDDTEQWDLFSGLKNLINSNQTAIQTELGHIRDWFESDVEGFHVYKMRIAENYSLSNITVD